jgi:methionyl-tRNA formyltransferase
MRDYVFVGNRRFVLERMLERGVSLTRTLVVKGTHLERDIAAGIVQPPCVEVVSSKQELLDRLGRCQFDVLVSNGCPYILPVRQFSGSRLVNIHPSCLPDLRGMDPVIGAILKGRDSGSTCHEMDDGIDTGPIISQVRIPYTPDLDVTTLYQLSFLAEREAFDLAFDRDFEPLAQQSNMPELVYYSRRQEDCTICFTESNEDILRKIRAFNNRRLGCQFMVQGMVYKVFFAQVMQNPYLQKYMRLFGECMVGMSYENGIVFRKDGQVIRFTDVVCPAGSQIPVGTFLRHS